MINKIKQFFKQKHSQKVWQLVINQDRRNFLLVFGLFIIITTAFFAVYKINNKAQAGWWNDTWQYRKSISISNTGNSRSNFVVQLSIDTSTLITANKMSGSCNDMRFIDLNGNELSFYLSNCNSATSNVFVRLNVVTGGTTIYMYYGNTSAKSNSDGANTFNFQNEPVTGISVAYQNLISGTPTLTSVNSENNVFQLNPSEKMLKYTGSNDATTGNHYAYYWTLVDSAQYLDNYIVQTGDYLTWLEHDTTGPGTGCGLEINFTDFTYLRGTATDQDSVSPNQNNTKDNNHWYWRRVSLASFVGKTINYVSVVSESDTPSATWNCYFNNIKIEQYTSTIAQGTTGSEEQTVSPIAYYSFDEGYSTTVHNQMEKNGEHGLTSYYKLDEGADNGCAGGSNDICDEKGLNDGTNSSATWATGHVGSALTTNGSSTYFQVPDKDGANDFDYDEDFTVSFWVKDAGTNANNDAIVEKWTSAFGPYPYVFRYDATNSLKFYRYDGTNLSGNFGTTVINDGSWHHIVGKKEGSYIYLYIDGVLNDSDPDITTGTTTNAYDIYIGSRGGTTNFWEGSVDELKIYNRALSDSEIVAQYNSVHGHMISMDEATDWVDGARQNPQQRPLGKALDFDGSNDFVEIPDTGITDFGNSQDFTISLWANTSMLGTYNTWPALIYKQKTSSTRQGYGIVLHNSDAPNQAWYGEIWTGGSQYTVSGASDIADGRWHHLVFQREDKTLRTYQDGILANTAYNAAQSGDLSNVYNLRMAIFTESSLFPFDGTLDEVKIYRKALNAEQIKKEYNRGAGAVMGAGTHAGAGAAPKGFWKLDEGSGYSAFDSSGNNNTGILTNMDATSDWVAGKVGKGLDFDGTNDYVSVADPGTSSLDITGALTASAWVKWDTLKDFGVILNKGTGSSATYFNYAIWSYASGKVSGYIGNGSTGNTVQSTTTFDTNVWYHITFIADGSNLKLYVNGSLDNTASQTITPAANNDNFTISQTSYILDGQIDHVKVYDYARTPEQIHYDMATGSPVAHFSFDEGAGTTVHNSQEKNGENGLISWWKFDTASSGTISTTYDEKGVNNGTGYNATYSSTAKIGNSGYFYTGDSTNDYVTVADNDSLDLTTVTISAWIRPTAVSGFAHILGKRDSASATTAYALRTQNDEFNFYWKNSGNWQVYTTSNADLVINTWYHIAATYDGTSVKVYKDGVLLTGSCTTGTCNNALEITDDNLGIGWSGEMGSEFWNGYLDSVKLYNRVLSAAEIAADYNSIHGHIIKITPSPTPVWVEGAKQNQQQKALGKALDFDDDSSERVHVPYNSKLNFSGRAAFSVSAWINPKINNAYGSIVSQSDGSTNTYVMAMNSSGRIEAGRITAATGSTVIPTNKWSHVVFTYDGTYINVYVNAAVDATPTSDINNAGSSDDLLIGAHNYTSPSVFFNGSIDEVKIYNYALTANEIKTEYNRGAAVVLGAGKSDSDTAENSLVGWWKMDEGSGFTISDSSKNETSFIFKNATNTTTLWGPGKLGKAAYFEGGSVYAMANNETNFDFERTDPFSISFWFKPNSSFSYFFQELFYKVSSGSVGYDIWYVPSDGYIRFDMQSGASYGNKIQTYAGSIKFDTWQHITATYDGSGNVSGMLIYINGIKQATTTIQSNLGANSILNNDYPRIGEGSGFDWFSGYLDNLKVYSKELSSAEVAWEYNQGAPIYHWDFNDGQGLIASNNQGKSVTTDGLVGFWTMDNTGTVVDLSGNGNNLANATSSATLGTGIKAGALSFPTTNKSQYGCTDANCGADLDYQGNGFTISTWVKATDFNQATWRNIVIKHYYNSSTDNGGYTISTYTDGRPYFLVRNSNGTNETCDAYALSGSIVSTTAWMHIVGVYDNNSCKIYINGVLHETEANPVGIKNVSEDFTIGGNAGGNYMFNGLIDHTKVWQRALTASEVAIEYGYDEKYGYLTNMDASTDWVDGAWPASNRPKLGKALDFDGSNDYLMIPDASGLQIDEKIYSFSFWIKPTYNAAQQIVMTKRAATTTKEFHILIGPTGSVSFDRYLPSGGGADSNGVITYGQWNHVAVVFNDPANTVSFYINGKFDVTASYTEEYTGTQTGHLYIGRDPITDNLPVSGQIDEVKIYNYGLTANQVKLDYNNSAAVRY